MAKKREQKSLASLIGKRNIDTNEIEQAATVVHEKQSAAAKKAAIPAKALPTLKEKSIKVSVATPQSLYLKAKGAALEEDIKSLKDFYLHCVSDYLKRKGKM